MADWLHDSGSVVYRGRRAEVASFSRFPSRGTDIYLGATAGRARGLALLHEGIHAIHHDLLYRYADYLDAAFPDALWLETTAHLYEQMAAGELRDHVAARSLVLARVHAVRASYAHGALEAGEDLEPESLSDRLAELYRDHLGALPPPCDAVTDLFLLDQNLVRARALAAGALLARTSCGTALAEAGSSAELFAAFRAVAAHLADDGVHVLADERAARSLETGSRQDGAA